MTPDPHEEFRQICALSTSGELAPEEWTRLREHLEHCDECRILQRQYELVVAAAVPALARENEAEPDDGDFSGSWSLEDAGATLMKSLENEPAPIVARPTAVSRSHWTPASRYAIAATILFACSVGAYRIGLYQQHRKDPMAAAPAEPVATINQPRDAQTAQKIAAAEEKARSEEQRATASLNQVRHDQLEIAKLKAAQNELEQQLAQQGEDLDRSKQDRADMQTQLARARSDAQSLEARLNLIRDQSTEDTAQAATLKTEINDLSAAIDKKDAEIARQQELLQYDRDIRSLISARNLYIAEIYDVAKTGDTQKPFGRIFYTKDKSLVFYGYDLDQQKGVQRASAFQAWGRSGVDRKHDISLGLLYKDDANQKRWVLKFDDPKTISQIDAVFITVEPPGGSAKPTSRPLLFSYLHLDPNHP